MSAYPAACEKCAPYGGRWQETPRGMAPCDCARGLAMKAASAPPVPRAPVLTDEDSLFFARFMTAIPWFPTDSAGIVFVAREIASMCNSKAEANRLVTEMGRRYGSKWPGVVEMRALFCSFARPRDCIEAVSPLLEEAPVPEYKSLGPSAAPSIAAAVEDLIDATALDRELIRRSRPKVRDIPVVRISEENRITQADIDRAVEEHRRGQAEQEISLNDNHQL